MVTQPSLEEAGAILERTAALSADFATRAGIHDAEGSFPFENFEALHRADLLSLTVPVELGGLGGGLSAACSVLEEVARGDASTALVLAMHYIYHGIQAHQRSWPAAVYKQLCRESVEGIALVNAMRVEPELGTPARGGLPATTAERTADGWRVTGHKMYATGSPILRYYLVWGRTGGDDPQTGTFLVPSDLPGIRLVETWDHLGMRATRSDDLLLEDVEIPYDYALELRPPREWVPLPGFVVAWQTVTLAALYQGVASAARDWLATYLHERKPANLGASLATLPRFQSAVGEIDALLYANERLIYGFARDFDEGGYTAERQPRASVVKYLANANAIHAVDIALGLVGNPGLSRHNPLERFHREVLCSRIHTPQDDTVTLEAGKLALGLGG